uniref:Cyclic GMP-AMP synthase-like n=1 Tax=Seriola dumerili TaxID=41447 RepID=A0A3B4VB02_SERDU
MTGRGRPRKEKNPDTKCAKSKTTPEEIKSLPKCQRKDFTEEKHNGATKEQKPKEREQKQPNHNDEKPSVQSEQKEKINKQQRMPTDNTKAPVQDTKAKTCASSATKTKPETPKGTTTDSLKPTKARKRSCKTKSTEQSAEETTNMTPAAPKETTKDSPKTTKARKRSCKTKSTEQSAEETTKMTPEAPKETTKDSLKTTKAKTGAGNDIAAVDSILFTTLNKLKIKKNDRANAAEVINEIIGKIIEHVKKNIDWFKEVEQLNTGSYYENLKISNPDEFDVMLAIPVDRVTIARFGNDGAYYSVGLKRGNSPLRRFQDTNTLSATKMLDEFREEVKKCVKAFPGEKKKGCPAVTMTTEVQSVTISLDVVLCLKVKSSWPDFTKDGFKIESWLGTKIRQAHRRKPYYLVPKYEGNGNYFLLQHADVWRISFSHVEKDILKNHGSVKTCCEKEGEHCCRLDLLYGFSFIDIQGFCRVHQVQSKTF